MVKEWVDWLKNVKVLQKAVVIDYEGNLLALRRKEEGPGARPGMWDLPGGSMSGEDLDETESPNLKAIAREVKEETGLSPKNFEAIFVDSGIKENKAKEKVLIIAIGFKCKADGVKPKIILSNEHIEWKWISKEEFLGLGFGSDGGFHLEVIKRV